MTIIYRRKRGPRYTWHWYEKCNNYPKEDYIMTSVRPASDLCNTCKGIEKDKKRKS